MENQETIKYRGPQDYLKVFFRRKLLFLSPICAGLVFGIVAALMLAPSYQSSTVILVQEEKVLNPLIQGLAVSTSINERMRTIKEQILGWNSLVELSKKLHLDRDITNQAGFEGLILGLRKNIGVYLRGPNLITLSYTGKNPRETQLVAKTLTDILIDQNMRSQTKETDVAITFIKEQLDLYKRKIKESEIDAMQEQLKKLLADSTEQHPLVRDLRQKMEIAKKELETGTYDVSGSTKAISGPIYETLKQELDKIIDKENSNAMGSADIPDAAQPSDPNAAIYKLMLMDKVDSVMARDMHVNENIYNMLLQKLETAKITQRLEASKEGTRYTVIDPPRLPLKPTKPNKFMVIFLGLFLGGISGAGLVLGREFIDRSFLDIEDAKNTLALPVLGGISRIITVEQTEKEKQKIRTLITVGATVSVMLIVTSMLYSLLRK